MFVREGSLRAIFASLAAFISAGIRPRTPLARAIVFVLILKLIGIAGIKIFMFPDGAQPVVDGMRLDERIGYRFALVGPPALVGSVAGNERMAVVAAEIDVAPFKGQAVLLRPDRYVLGTATNRAALQQMLEFASLTPSYESTS